MIKPFKNRKVSIKEYIDRTKIIIEVKELGEWKPRKIIHVKYLYDDVDVKVYTNDDNFKTQRNGRLDVKQGEE